MNKKLFIIIIFSITLWLGGSFVSPVLAEEGATSTEEQVCQPTEEICDGIDNDCDGQVDEELTQQCGTTDTGVCEFGIQTCQAGVWGECLGAIEPSEEVCDGLDNDCDGQVDEDLGQTTCGIGACKVTIDNCLNGEAQTCTPGTPTEEICGDSIDNDCDGKTDAEDEDCQIASPVCDLEHLNLCTTETDCLATSGFWYNETCNSEPEESTCQPTEEICDGLDNDCDGEIDEGGVCETATSTEPSATSTEPVCEPSEEICDGLDNDCDDLIDEDLGQTTCGIGACQVTIDNCLYGAAQTCIPGIPVDEICDGIDNNCNGQIDEGGVCEEPPQPEPVVPIEPGGRFDPATAPSRVTIRVLMPDGNPPSFPVFVTFVGVGNKNFGGRIDVNGELRVIMPQGRYYTELLVLNTEYVQGEDGPSFFLEANEERDFGAIRLMLKAEQTSQKLEDKVLEENILAEVESSGGLGRILVLIIKLLMKILEEIRSIASLLASK